jgi:heme exporter protein B
MLLERVAAGIVMAMAALSSLLSLDRLFAGDFEDGSLDGLALSPLSLELVALAKVLSHWLMTGLPLLIAAPVLGLLLNLPKALYPILMLAVMAVTPALSLLGGLGAALTLGSRRSGLLLAFLILPLFIPILILGMGAVTAISQGSAPWTALQLLGALDIGFLALVPWAMAVALRQLLR